jgi:hypothetical protein
VHTHETHAAPSLLSSLYRSRQAQHFGPFRSFSKKKKIILKIDIFICCLPANTLFFFYFHHSLSPCGLVPAHPSPTSFFLVASSLSLILSQIRLAYRRLTAIASLCCSVSHPQVHYSVLIRLIRVVSACPSHKVSYD